MGGEHPPQHPNLEPTLLRRATRTCRSAHVYFDTCFYLGLGGLDEDAAAAAIRRVWELDVRPIASWPLLVELQGAPRSGDSSMMARMMRLPPPVGIPEGLTWSTPIDPRMFDPTERVQIVSAFARRGANETEARTLATQAGLPYPGSKEEGLAIARDLLSGQYDLRRAAEELGHDPREAGIQDGDPVTLASLGIDLAQLLGFPPPPDDPSELQAWAEQALAQMTERQPDVFRILGLQDELIDHDVAESQTLGHVPLGEGSRSAKSRHRGHIRDSRHVVEVLQHRDLVDFFQLDHARFARARREPDHPVARYGLMSICFAGKDVPSMLDALEDVKGSPKDE